MGYLKSNFYRIITLKIRPMRDKPFAKLALEGFPTKRNVSVSGYGLCYIAITNLNTQIFANCTKPLY